MTAKRKPSVAQRDSIFANPAAHSRRLTEEAVSLATQGKTIEAGGGMMMTYSVNV